jgi:hypothetical protein
MCATTSGRVKNLEMGRVTWLIQVGPIIIPIFPRDVTLIWRAAEELRRERMTCSQQTNCARTMGSSLQPQHLQKSFSAPNVRAAMTVVSPFWMREAL